MVNVNDEILNNRLSNISDTVYPMDRQQIAECGRVLLQNLKIQIETLK